jgi:hypothetical protein
MNLHDIKKHLLLNNYEAMRDSLKEVKHIKQTLEHLKPEFEIREEYVKKVQTKFEDKVTHLVALKNSIKAETLVRKAQLLFKALQQINRTLNPLALSIILRENQSVLSAKDDFKGITEIEKRLDWINKISEELTKNSEKRFNEAFEAKDQSTMKNCVQIFFNMEILNEKIQTVANNVLRTLFTRWKTTITACQEKIGTFIKKDEEMRFIEIQVKEYSNEVCRYTLQIYTL